MDYQFVISWVMVREMDLWPGNPPNLIRSKIRISSLRFSARKAFPESAEQQTSAVNTSDLILRIILLSRVSKRADGAIKRSGMAHQECRVPALLVRHDTHPGCAR